MLLVGCHDAGGAELVSSWQRRERLPARYAIAGPALQVFQRKLGNDVIAAADDTEVEWGGITQLVVGTSWPACLEWKLLGEARRRGIPSAAFVDHWVNYPLRFVREGRVHLPDELWVADTEADRVARETLPLVPVRLVGNPYLDDLADSVAGIKRGTDGVALFVGEPLSERALQRHGNARYWGYTEVDALAYFLQALPMVAPEATNVVVRPHPAELGAKYAIAAEASPVPLRICADVPLERQVAGALVVAGCNTMALAVADRLGVPAYCAIPPHGPPCAIPLPSIRRLRNDGWHIPILHSKTE